MSTIPQELDWISKRAECSAIQMFNELLKGIRDDVATYNRVKDIPEQNIFAAEMTRDGTSVAIGQYGNVPRARVLIGVVREKIVVQDDAKQTKWSAEVKLNREGRCVLRLEDGEEVEQWQFRKRALEGLFFGD